MINATMPISDMKNPKSCIPELAIVFPSYQESLPSWVLSVLSSRKISKWCWSWWGKWAEPGFLSLDQACEMWAMQGRGGCVIITTTHACRCGGMEGVGADGTGLLRFSAKQQVAGHSALFFSPSNQIKQMHGTAQPELWNGLEHLLGRRNSPLTTVQNQGTARIVKHQ